MAIDSNCGWENGFGRTRTLSGMPLLPVLGTGLAGSYTCLKWCSLSLSLSIPTYKKNEELSQKTLPPPPFYTWNLRLILILGAKNGEGKKPDSGGNKWEQKGEKEQHCADTVCSQPLVPVTYLLIHLNMYLELILVPTDKGMIPERFQAFISPSHSLTCRINRK